MGGCRDGGERALGDQDEGWEQTVLPLQNDCIHPGEVVGGPRLWGPPRSS